MKRLKKPASWPISSFEVTGMRRLKSPLLAFSKWSISFCSGRVIELLIFRVKGRTRSMVMM